MEYPQPGVSTITFKNSFCMITFPVSSNNTLGFIHNIQLILSGWALILSEYEILQKWIFKVHSRIFQIAGTLTDKFVLIINQ